MHFMSIVNRISTTAAVFLICITGLAQNLSNRGTEFYVGYGHHQFFENGQNSQEMVLYLSAEEAATVTVTINGTGYSQVYNVIYHYRQKSINGTGMVTHWGQ